ncbi:GAF domain-containing sensor histidine kinase [Ktedonospora formicarum]|uniref:histidine kinase n=1 Tax=Ktedonospora formicarum TaxID=2778364 RepID=A0A8J3I4Q1_9CHLR|nr:HAMP domain-containing sensor histidine kinase [Ktedonospora formicarum]GHO49439.1 hypothetical protein KSX_76020 [Ktedonospora formicarum]
MRKGKHQGTHTLLKAGSHSESVVSTHIKTEAQKVDPTPLQTFVSTLSDLPTYQSFKFPEQPWFLLSEITDIAQRLVELAKNEMDCDQVVIYAHSYPDNYVYILSATGLTDEQLHHRCKAAGLYTMSEYLDPDIIATLQAKKVVVIPRSQIHIPLEYEEDFNEQAMLIAPLFAQDKLVGLLIVGRTEKNQAYDQHDINLVKAIATLIVLVIEHILVMRSWTISHANELALKESNQRMNTFINQISHELNTPLTSMIGNLQLAQLRLQRCRREYPDQPDIQRRMDSLQLLLHSAWESAHKQKHLIGHMIDDALLQSNNFTLRKGRYNLANIARETVATIQPHFPDHHIRLTFVDKAACYPVFIDSERIEEVLHIYIDNALAYSSDQYPIDVTIRKDDKNVYAQVHDHGPGISPEDQVHIWERFYRTKGVGVQHELDLSLGLSLYLSRSIIELHQGQVGITSIPGGGSTFWFSIPLLQN